MKLRFIITLVSVFIFSCSENIKSDTHPIIKSKEFLNTLDSFLIESPIRRTEPPNSILVYLNIKESDTILDLFDQPLFDCVNFVDTIHYKNREIFFFTENNLRKRLNELVVLSNKNSINCDELVDTSSLYVSYHSSFILQDGSIKQKLD